MRTFVIDEQVKHKLFGEGVVLAVVGYDEFAKLTIKFKEKGVGTKTIIAKYIKLSKN